jgi:SAM-dependent methyltransferase
MDPLSGTPWSEPRVVAGFTQTQPNAALLRLVEEERRRSAGLRVLDIGCGAGRNALPMARLGCEVLGLDLSWPMLEAARRLTRTEASPGTAHLALAPMDALPVRTGAFDLVVAHGIWNLAQSSAEFRNVGHEDRDARAAELLGQDAQGNRLAGAGGAGDQSVTVGHLRQDGNLINSFGDGQHFAHGQPRIVIFLVGANLVFARLWC